MITTEKFGKYIHCKAQCAHCGASIRWRSTSYPYVERDLFNAGWRPIFGGVICDRCASTNTRIEGRA